MNDTKNASGGGRRGRPREFDREQALDRAMMIFWRDGYEGASLAELTAAMKITPPSLYAAFGSKEQLYEEALRRYAQTLGADTAKAIQDAPSAFAAVRAVLETSARDFCEAGKPAGCMIASASLACGQGSRPAMRRAKEMRAQSLEALQGRFERGRDEGELPADVDTAGLARYYGAVLQGMSIQARDGASRQELAVIAELSLRAWPGRTKRRRQSGR